MLPAEKGISLHFACHGQYDWTRSWENHLALADKDRLKATDIFNSNLSKFNLGMSACESALSDYVTDYYVSSAPALLEAGVLRETST